MPKPEIAQEEVTKASAGPSRPWNEAKTAVLNSLTSASGQRTYEQAIREFVAYTLPAASFSCGVL
jgi:hypothetical protein